MEMYYNYLNDRMEELNPEYHAMNLPKSKEEYEERVKERNGSGVYSNYKSKLEYPLHPNDCVHPYTPLPTIGDEVVDNNNSMFGAGLQLEEKKDVYSDELTKRMIEKGQLFVYDEAGQWKDKKALEEAWMKLKEEVEEVEENISKALDPLKYHPANQGNPEDNFERRFSGSCDPIPNGTMLFFTHEDNKPNIKKMEMPITTYPIKPVATKESFYDIRPREYENKNGNSVSEFDDVACLESFYQKRETSEEDADGVENYEVVNRPISKKGKYLAIFLLMCGGMLGFALILKAIL